MKKLPYLLVLSGLLSSPLAALAEGSPVTGNFGLTTDYIFRGISQSQHKPAVSGGIDYTHASGLYAGTWFSNQEWVDVGAYKTNSSLEWDLYGGYRGTVASDIGYDVGIIHYEYPGDGVAGAPSPDTTEVYLGASWKFLSVKYSHTVSKYFVGWTGAASASTRGTGYLELNGNYDLGDGWGVLGHVGHQSVKHDNFNNASYTDWKVGVTKDIGFGALTLAYSDTNGDGKVAGQAYHWGSEDVSKGVLALSFSKSF